MSRKEVGSSRSGEQSRLPIAGIPGGEVTFLQERSVAALLEWVTMESFGRAVYGPISVDKIAPPRATARDELILRELRLLALGEAPYAFGSTYNRELTRTMKDWRCWLSPGVTFILEETRMRLTASLWGRGNTVDPTCVHLMAMWVRPSIRGTGAADKLMSAALSWRGLEDAQTVRLSFVKGNDRARYYIGMDFRLTGEEL